MSATGMHPCRRGRAAGGVGAAGDDQGPATARQQGPGRTDADITAWGGQGSGGSAAGDPTARPRGPPPTGPASRPVGNRRAPRLFHAATSPAAGSLDEQTTRGRQDSGCSDGDPAAQTRGPPPTWPASRPSRDSTSRSFQAVPLPAAGVLDGRTAPGGQGRERRTGDPADRASGDGTSKETMNIIVRF